MSNHELEKLLGGFAADTLTPEERTQLYQAALKDQQLFNALADEQALKELLADPLVRRRLLQALNQHGASEAGGRLSWLDWFRRPAGLAFAGGLAAAVFAVVLGTKIYQDSLKQAVQSAATEEGTPVSPPPPTTAPLTSPPAPSEPVEPPSKAKENLPLATELAKKDSNANRMVRREQPATSKPEKQRDSGADPDVTRQRTEQDNVGRQTETSPMMGLGKTTDELTPSAGEKQPETSALPTAEQKIPQPVPAPLARSAGETPIVSARALFYTAEPDRLDQTEPEQKLSSKSMSEGRRALRSESKNERFAAAGAPAQFKPLGLRYGFAIRSPDGKAEETDAATALKSADQARLTIEVNQDAYLQIWKTAGTSSPELWFPTKETGQISMKVPAGRRQGISLAEESETFTLTVRLSRVPFGPITEQEAATLDIPSNQLQETITPQDPSGPQEQATYVVNTNPSPTVQITVEIPPGR